MTISEEKECPETFSNARVNLGKKMGPCKRLSICIYRKELCFYRIEKDYVRIIRVLNVLFHIYFARLQPTRTKPSKMKFVGRELELDKLNKMMNSDNLTYSLIYGRRRVGKSELIKQAMLNNSGNGIYYECKQVT